MTSQEYYKAYTAARRRWPSLIRSGMSEIKAAYALAAEAIEQAFVGASGLAAERLSSINTQLAQATATIAESLMAEIPAVVSAGQALYGAIDAELLGDLFAGSEAVTADGIENMIARVNQRLIADTINRVYQDGYTFSSKCWQIGGDYQDQIKRLINSGIAQGKSTADIARSISEYTTGGRDVLDGAYGSAKYGDVVVKNVDWRALRLVRTELSASMKIGAVMQGEQNPGCTGEYDWIRINTQQHNCECPALAAGSPYKAADVPNQKHSNCMCQVRPRLRDLKETTADIKRWSAGESVPYLDEWYGRNYVPGG